MLYNPDYIRAQTAKMRVPVAPDAPEPTRDQQIADLIAGKFGCHKEQTRQLVELLLERELPHPNPSIDEGPLPVLLTGAVITYNRKQTMIAGLDEDGDASVINGDLTDESPSGGNLLTRGEYHNQGRAATEAELERFITRLTKAYEKFAA